MSKAVDLQGQKETFMPSNMSDLSPRQVGGFYRIPPGAQLRQPGQPGRRSLFTGRLCHGGD